MKHYLPFIVIGLVTGAVYALASMGLVLTYVTSGVFNFAQGAIGMFATFVFWSLRVDGGLPTPLAMAVAILGVGPLIGVTIDRVLLRRLHGAGQAAFLVTSLGVLVALQGLATALYGSETRPVEPIFPTWTYRLPGVNVGIDQTVVVVVAVLAGFGLAYFLRRSHVGLQTRAVVGDRDLAELVGTNSRRITTLAWVVGSAFAALSGILFAPFVQLDSVVLTLLVVQAFGAAIVGGLRNLSLTNVGAYGIGVGAALITKLVASKPSLAGLPSALPFIVLFLVLVGSRRGRFSEVTGDEPRAGGLRARKNAMPWSTLVALTALAAVLPLALNQAQLLTATTTVAFVLLFASLSLLVGLCRLVSLAHAMFAALGVTTLAHFLTAGLPYPLALLAAAAVMVPVGAILAVPAIRLSGLFLALATFGFGVLGQFLLFPSALAFGSDSLAYVPRPHAFRGDTAFYYLVLVVVVLGVILIEAVRVTRLGRIMRAVADSPVAVQSLGVNPTASRVLIFCLSAFLAAIAGGLLGSIVQVVNPISFDYFQSLLWLTVLVAAGAGTLGGSVLAAILLVGVPAVFTSATVTEWQPVAFGVAAIVLAQAPNGLAGVLFRRPDLSALARQSAGRLSRRRSHDRYVTAALGRAR